MTNPQTLLSDDREVTWPDSRGTLRRVDGPVLVLPEGETLSWFDPLDGRPQATCAFDTPNAGSFVTAVEWPEGFPDGRSAAAVCVGDPSAVAVWESDSAFSTDRGLGCVVRTGRAEEVARRLLDVSEVLAVLSAVRASMVQPLSVAGEVVGIAFHCGMGASTNLVHVGRDASGRVVALLADLDLLTGAEPQVLSTGG